MPALFANTGERMPEYVSHEGIAVIAGEIESTAGDHCAVLKAGNGERFDSTLPHRFPNIGDREATVVPACAPPCLRGAELPPRRAMRHLAISTSSGTGCEMRHSSTRAGLPSVISMISISAVF